MAYSFNGTSQYLTSITPLTAAPLTFAALGKATNATAINSIICIADDRTDSSFIRLSMQGAVSGDPVEMVSIQPSGAFGAAQTTLGYTANVWYATCGANASTASRKAYLNGGNSGTSTNTVTPTNINKLGIGITPRSSLFGYFAGALAEAAIWNVALSDEEAVSLAKGFKPTRIRPQSLVFYAPLIRTLQDTRGGLTITNNNSATVADHPRVY